MDAVDAARRQVLLDAGRALLLLPVFLALWYAAGPALAVIPGKIAVPVVRLMADGSTSMDAKDRTLVYTVKLEMPYQRGRVSPRIAADVEVNAAKFTYGIALFLALALAARESRKALGIFTGCAILLISPFIGIAFDALKQLGAAGGLAPFLGWGAAKREFVALVYQVGTLLLPTLLPVAIWLVLVRERWAPKSIAPEGAAT
jgi:hypothetical protein